MKPFSVFILALCFSLTLFFGQNYNMIRRTPYISSSRAEYDQPDLVQIPSSLCYDNGNTECPLMDGKNYSVCQCVCGKTDNSHVYYMSTFGFYNGSWKCEKNSALRRSSGCQLSLDLKNLDYPIVTVPTTIGDNRIHFISNVTTINYLNFPENGTCSIIAENSMYLTCFGEWKSLDTTLVIKRFHVKYTDSWLGKNVELQVNYKEGSSSTYPLPSGRIIKLAVTCSDRPWEPSQCILLKIEGRLECPVSPPRPTTPPSQPTMVHPTFMTSPTTPPARTWKPTTGGSRPSSADNSKVVAGLLGGLALLLTLIIIIILIIRGIKKRKEEKQGNKDSIDANNPRTRSTSLSEFPTNYIHEDTIPQSTDGADYQYDYAMAYVNNAAGYDKYENQANISPDNNYGYESMDGLNNSLSQKYVNRRPSYDDVNPEQRHDTQQVSRPETERNSEYHSLEGNVPHVYGSLQVPRKTQDKENRQMKSVDSSIYGSLEGNVPHIYGSLQRIT